ncbi:MAG TPA: ATP-binding protein [Beutenbergiaceae bacterium]|nr:ATP-binding protein [Beutenbergiaceae bacterium]
MSIVDGLWLLLAALAGVLVGVGVGLWYSRRDSARNEADASRKVGDDVASVLSALRSVSVVLGPDDEILRATPPAYSLGLVRSGVLTHLELEKMVARARRDGHIQDAHLMLPRSKVPGSDILAVDVRVAPLPADRILILADDRTAERRVEEVRRDFVANVSHELKTPVGAIALLAETAADAADDSEAVRHFTSQMSREASRLSALVQEIIELSRLQAPEKVVDYQRVSIDEVIAEAVDRAGLEAEAREMPINVGGERGLEVFGDHGLLVTAVRNLVDNAVRYSPAGSPVNLGVRNAEGVVEIAVVDQGAGISPENTDRVFERFFRADPARSRETGGTGLGLSIVKHVAANHGGEVTVWSTKGRGSTFTLRIPEVDPEMTVVHDEGENP